MNLVLNERLKLFATYLNGLAIAIFAVGGSAPLISYLSGSASAAPLQTITITSLVCFLVSAAPHYAGSLILTGLKP